MTAHRRWLAIIRLVLLVVGVVCGSAYFLASASLLTIFIVATVILLLVISLIRVAAWGLDNTPPFDF